MTLLQKEYELWVEELEKIISEKSICRQNRRQLLKLMSMNHFDMEENSRDENLVAFKKSYGKSLQTVENCLEKFFPAKTAVEK